MGDPKQRGETPLLRPELLQSLDAYLTGGPWDIPPDKISVPPFRWIQSQMDRKESWHEPGMDGPRCQGRGLDQSLLSAELRRTFVRRSFFAPGSDRREEKNSGIFLRLVLI